MSLTSTIKQSANSKQIYNDIGKKIQNGEFEIDNSLLDNGSVFFDGSYDSGKFPLLIIYFTPALLITNTNTYIEKIGYFIEVSDRNRNNETEELIWHDETGEIVIEPNSAGEAVGPNNSITIKDAPNLIKFLDQKFGKLYISKLNPLIQKDIERWDRTHDDGFNKPDTLGDVDMSTSDLREIINYFRNK